MTKSKYIEFGRDRAYYDFENMHELNKYHLKIAAGYKASMDIYQDRILLCTELAHKLINLGTVWDEMENIFRSRGVEDGKGACFAKLVGSTIMTSYSRRTYRIDDIDWEKSPTDLFEKKVVNKFLLLITIENSTKLRLEIRNNH